MRWGKDNRRKSGGYWLCAVKKRAANAHYDKTEKGRVARERYAKTEKGRTARARRNARYKKSEKGRQANARHNVRSNAKRIRIGEVYVGMEHHFPVDREVVVAHLNAKREKFLAKQAAEREAFNENFSRKQRGPVAGASAGAASRPLLCQRGQVLGRI